MRALRLLVATAAIAASGAACGDSTTTTLAQPTTSPAPTTTTTAAAVPTTVATTTTPTSLPPDTEAPPPPDADADAAAAFAITAIAFGDSGFIQISNVGNAAGDPGGHWLCQRPAYYEIPSVALGPGQSVWVAADKDDLQFVGAVVAAVDAAGTLGRLAASSGEVALYAGRDFSDPGAIVDYVEWGTSGHGRSGVAVDAGIWPAGGFVETPDGTIAITSGGVNADAPAAWAPDIGV
jgi:hypothetical protein